jgi:hypothetical protein
MRDFHRLPPFLNAASIVGRLFWVACVTTFFIGGIFDLFVDARGQSQTMSLGPALMPIELSLLELAGACYVPVFLYSAHFHRPTRQTRFVTTRSHASAVFFMGIVPLCALALSLIALLPPPAEPTLSLAFGVAIGLGLIALMVEMFVTVLIADRMGLIV